MLHAATPAALFSVRSPTHTLLSLFLSLHTNLPSPLTEYHSALRQGHCQEENGQCRAQMASPSKWRQIAAAFSHGFTLIFELILLGFSVSLFFTPRKPPSRGLRVQTSLIQNTPFDSVQNAYIAQVLPNPWYEPRNVFIANFYACAEHSGSSPHCRISGYE